MKIYTGAPAAARNYVEADRSRADDYYLAEGTGVAQHFTVDSDGRVIELPALTGDTYEGWVAGADPDTGEPRGRLRTDGRAVRFIEVTVNGPKSWSLAAELHPDIAAAYEAAQDNAAAQVISWLGLHATTRVGPRGGQVAVPVERLEAVTVRHYTSRAGDPHRHLHLQVNARVFAAGKWRGLDTVAVRESLNAVNGIGHAAVATDPQFRRALAAHGLTLDTDAEIVQLAPYVGAFSARAGQIMANLDRYEADWTAANPGQTPGPGLRRAWDARAWADGRPDKVIPKPGTDLNGRWLTELAALGYRDRDRPVDLTPAQVGALGRDQAVEVVLARLGAARSAWNAADIRGEVEQLLVRIGVVAGAAVRAELAEDLTARALTECVPLVGRDGVPEHIRAFTSRPVLAVEDDVVGRLAVRATEPGTPVDPADAASLVAHAMRQVGRRLDDGQALVVAALAGNRPLLVIEGAAGVGKTTTLATARAALARQGHGLLVVTPTLKAATVARSEVGGQTGSAAWLAYQYGWRWDQHGTWTRLTAEDTDPVTGRVYLGPTPRARLRQGDLLLVDEAGMLDQDTARALLTIADEQHARVALIGDRHQLAAVGRGGVLELVHRWAEPDTCLSLTIVHRFTRQQVTADGRAITVPDSEYAALTVAMRNSTDPGAVFDALHARGQIRIHPHTGDLQQSVAAAVTDSHHGGEPVSVVADTRDQVAALNAAIRDQLTAAGIVEDQHVVTTRAGERIGAGDTIATRRNDRRLDVANRDSWTVTAVGRDGELTVTKASGDRRLPAAYADRYVELAYATTIHGAQGDTTNSGHLVLSEQTGAASGYVGMTRGRHTNTAHLIADNLDDARAQWVAAFGRDRADLGPTHARQLALTEAGRYAVPRPVERVLAELRTAWTQQANCRERLELAVPRRDDLAAVAVLQRDQSAELAVVQGWYEQAKQVDLAAKSRVEHSEAVIANRTGQIRAQLSAQWTDQFDAAHAQARTALAGPGRLKLKLAAVNRATEQLAAWSISWQPILPDMPTGTDDIAHYADRYQHQPHLHEQFERYARTQAEHEHPEHEDVLAAAGQAGHERAHCWQVLGEVRQLHQDQRGRYGNLAHTEHPEQDVDRLDRDIATIRRELSGLERRVGALTSEPAITARPAQFLAGEQQAWRADHTTERELTEWAAIGHAVTAATVQRRQQIERSRSIEHNSYQPPQPDRGHGISR